MSWETVQIKDICKQVTSGGTPLTSKENYYFPHQIPWIKTKEVNFCRITDAETYISQEGLDNSSAKLIPANSVIIAMYGQGDTAGRVAINKIPVATNQACCNLIVDESKAEYRFVYYKLSTMYAKLVSLKNGGAQPNLNAAIIKSLEISIPNLEVQHSIADILSAYDDLIENNQKQIKLLEEAAQRLYKEWFVDLRFPGHETTPITDGIPEGWKHGKIGDFVPTFSGGTPSRSHPEYYTDGTNLWVKTQELNDGFLFYTEEKITNDAISNSSAKIIPQGSILMAMYGATIGKLGIAAKEVTCNQACCVFDLTKVRFATSYLFLWLKENRVFFISQGKGAAQPNLSQAMIKQFDIIIPADKILEAFAEITDSMLEKIAKLQLQIIGLTEARDRLLPKLMNGEIEV